MVDTCLNRQPPFCERLKHILLQMFSLSDSDTLNLLNSNTKQELPAGQNELWPFVKYLLKTCERDAQALFQVIQIKLIFQKKLRIVEQSRMHVNDVHVDLNTIRVQFEI